MDALKTKEKIIRENAFEQKKKKPGLKFNRWLVLIRLQTTGSYFCKSLSRALTLGLWVKVFALTSSIIQTRMLYTSFGQVSTTFKADNRRNLLSVLAKITPSPDWSVGVDRINLCDGNCTWKKQIVQDLYPWDAGKTTTTKTIILLRKVKI